MIGIDIGGANLKVVDGEGVHIHYCPLWEGAPLAALLERYAGHKSQPAAVVMSGELADCFESRMQGIAFIVDAVKRAFPGAVFYGTDAQFHSGAVPQLAAANWLASAGCLRARYHRAVLVDMGSTTTDIVPLSRFDDLLGLTDLLRLQKGYLIYTGLLRTNIATVLDCVTLAGVPTPVSSEYFATSADAYLVLGHITPEQYSCDTPDKSGKSRAASLRRLARVVCSDTDDIGECGAVEIAAQFQDRQMTVIRDRVKKVMAAAGSSEVVTAGTGAALLARELCGTDLSAELGEAAYALPAYAVKELAEKNRTYRNKPDDGG
jgi:probable H4MPT-linked C1 transfer pathway protein